MTFGLRHRSREPADATVGSRHYRHPFQSLSGQRNGARQQGAELLTIIVDTAARILVIDAELQTDQTKAGAAVFSSMLCASSTVVRPVTTTR